MATVLLLAALVPSAPAPASSAQQHTVDREHMVDRELNLLPSSARRQLKKKGSAPLPPGVTTKKPSTIKPAAHPKGLNTFMKPVPKQETLAQGAALVCYVQRYPDLLDGFCGGAATTNDLHKCRWEDLLTHWKEHGTKEGRVFGCTRGQGHHIARPPVPGAAPPPAAPRSHVPLLIAMVIAIVIIAGLLFVGKTYRGPSEEQFTIRKSREVSASPASADSD